MPSAYLADDLIDAIRESGMLAGADESAQTARLRAIMNREQRVYLTKLMLSVREEYRTATVDVTLATSQTEVPIPSRAVGAKLKLVELVDSGGARSPLTPISNASQPADALAGGHGGYYLRDNTIVLVSAQVNGTTLRLHYPRRLNKIVAEEEASEITAINTSTKVVTLDVSPNAKPSGFLTTATFDLIKGTPHFDLLGSDLAISATDATTMTFVDTLPDDLDVGDYVSLAGETPICQAPVELQDVLVQRALVKYLESQGDPRITVAKAALDELRADALSLISPRVEDQPKPLINYDAPGWRRFPRRWGR